MKKIILFILSILAINTMAQDKNEIFWPKGSSKEFALDSITVPIVDTIMTYPELGRIGGYVGVIEFDMSGLDSSVIINIGGGNSIIRSTRPVLYSFSSYMNDSLPYTLLRLKWVKTINGVTQNKKPFPITTAYAFPFLAIYVKNAGCTAGRKLYFNARFSKLCD